MKTKIQIVAEAVLGLFSKRIRERGLFAPPSLFAVKNDFGTVLFVSEDYRTASNFARESNEGMPLPHRFRVVDFN